VANQYFMEVLEMTESCAHEYVHEPIGQLAWTFLNSHDNQFLVEFLFFFFLVARGRLN